MAENEKKQPLKAEDLQNLDLKPEWARGESDKVSVVRKQNSSGGKRGKSGRGRDKKANRDGKKKGSRTFNKDRSPRRQNNAGMSRQTASGAARKKASDLPLEISFIPERRGLGVIVRRIRNAKKAFPLPAIADLFLKKNDYYMVKVESKDSEFHLYQCTHCSQLFQSESAGEDHLFDAHADHYFDIETVETDPPSGNFPVIAKCGLCGEILAPPNHHTYKQRVREVRDSRYPDMPLAKYEERIEATDDDSAVEEWKQKNSSKQQYTPKGDSEMGPLDAEGAKKYMADNFGRKDLRRNKRFVVPATAAWKTEDTQLLQMFRAAWQKEKNFPITLIHALRPALRHMKLNIFKVGKKATYVCAVQPAPIDPEHSVSPIKEMLDYIQQNPGCSRDKLLEGVRGSGYVEAEEGQILKSLHWLVDCGHVVEFTDGTLSVPVGRNRVEK